MSDTRLPFLRNRLRIPGVGSQDLAASFVVFLVALPLCMGIAIASGVPAEKGLITGIVGGVVVGALAGSPLQVSGPAAGLAVIVFDIVQRHGIGMLGPLLVLAGFIQLIAGVARLGQWFRAISPAVVHGMLAGIGLLIVASQIQVLVGEKPLPHGLANLMAIPSTLAGLSPGDPGRAEATLLVGLATIAAMVGWDRFKPARLRLLPGALMGVMVGALLAIGLQLPVQRIDVPESLLAAVATPGAADFGRLLEPTLFLTAVALAFIASAETLLSAAAVDRMHDGPRTQYNRELFAQGVGNMICGAAGALPMTGVIVRSSANVQAGAMTRASAILHGVWLLGFVALLPGVLTQVPNAALAGVLVVTGWRLVKLDHARELFGRYGVLPAAIWALTFFTVVAADLLTGVLVGLALTTLELIPHLKDLRLRVSKQAVGSDAHELALEGRATFVQLPRLTRLLEQLPDGGVIRLDASRLKALDHTCAEHLREWLSQKGRSGARVEVEAGRFAPQLAAGAH
jgi:MFS superfamily sulfate permease-like transporter